MKRLSTPLAAMILISGSNCTTATPEAKRPAPVPTEQARSIALAAGDLPFAELEIAPSSRPGGAEPQELIPITGSWRYTGTTKAGMHKYETALPFRPRGLFFHKAQPGMALRTKDGAKIKYDRFGRSEKPMWSHDRKKLIVYLPDRSGPPASDAFTLTYPKAHEREKALNFDMSGIEAADDFARTEIADDWDTRSGLLLPAPSKAAWELELPQAAELHMVTGLVEPEVMDMPPSDGAKLVVEVEVGGTKTEVYTRDLQIQNMEDVKVDLSAWSGQTVKLRLRTEPGASSDLDYAFIGEPVVTSRVADPVTVFMVFIDTLRPDHMSLYGYSRDTTAKLDGLRDRAAVFTEARSIAPWTLPSARTLLTGRHPEYYSRSETLQGKLREEGYATAMFAGNVYLSANFDMTRDWDMHRVGLWPMASEVTDDALAWLDAHDGRNALLQVHYMDPHLPYTEPETYRYLYSEGDPPPPLRWEFHLSDVRRARVSDPKTQDWIRGRYDNNIRYTTDQVARLLERMDDNDWLILFSDHGEEFWEHKGFEHGHTLFDELLRVPLVIDGPGVDARRIETPVSLLDVTPTILDALGLPLEGMDGSSLLPIIAGDPQATAAMAERDQAFGRPLYGMRRWGVLHGGTKWTTTEGREAIYDLRSDRAEKQNFMIKEPEDKGAPHREYLAGALGRPVHAGYRLVNTRHRGGGKPGELRAECTVPGGVAAAWVADDPLNLSSAEVKIVGDKVQAAWHAGFSGSREVFFAPTLPMAEVTHTLTCEVIEGDDRQTLTVPENREATLGRIRVPLARARFKSRMLALTFGIGPEPDELGQKLDATDDESAGWLEALGYTDRQDGK